MSWNLTHNPFVKQPPRDEATRHVVFTGREFELAALIDCARQCEPCCLYGTYGMGKSMLMLEACRIIKAKYPNIVPVYMSVDPGLEYKEFPDVVLAGISDALKARGIGVADGTTQTAFEVIRHWTQAALSKNLTVFAMIDDMDRPKDIEKISSVIHSVRAMRDYHCGICLPANPNHATHQFATAGQGILERIDLMQLQLNEYVEMVARYLETARISTCDITPSAPKVFLSYGRPDVEEVDRLYKSLRNLGFRPWMDRHDLHGGEKWRLAIEREISKTDMVVLCLSEQTSNRRGYVRTEIRLALDALKSLLDSDIFLIPVRLGPCEIPEELKNVHCVDLFSEGGLVALEKSIREGIRRRIQDGNRQDQDAAWRMSTFPFDTSAIEKIVTRVGGIAQLTPRMLNTACGTLLRLASEQGVKSISDVFVESVWERIGAHVLSNEGDIERCARLVKQLMEHEGTIDEDSISLESVLEMLNRSHGGFADLLGVFGESGDVFHVEDRGGNLTIQLNPLIDLGFVRNVFLKKSAEEFRQEFSRIGPDEPRDATEIFVEKVPIIPVGGAGAARTDLIDGEPDNSQ